MNKVLNRGVCLLLLFLYSFSLLALIIQSIGCSVQPAFYLWTALLCISTWYTTCTRSGMLIGLPVSALILFAASRVFPSDLSLQLSDVLDRLTGAYMEQIVYPGEAYAYLNGTADHSLLLLLFIFLLASYMGAAVSSRSGRVGLALLGSVPFFVTCLAVSSFPPVLPVFGMLLFWFLLAVGGAHYDEETASYRRILGALLPLSLLLSLLLVYVDPKEYEYDPSQSPVRQTVDSLFKSLDEWLNERFNGERLSNPDAESGDTELESENELPPERPSMPWLDGSGALDLTRSPGLSELEALYLRVRAEQNGSLYLRAVSFGDYTGTGWTRTEEHAPVSSLAFAAEAVAASGTENRDLRVQVLQESPFRILPYFSLEEKGYDSFVPAGLASQYTAHYRGFPASFTGLTLPDTQHEAELSYRSYAYAYYTALPESTRASLQDLCVQNGLYPDMEDPISQVAYFVQHAAEYDAEAGAYPSSDYALYFLTTARRGTCVHFATAAAALYRTLGIPARVTEGFLLDAKANESVDVKGYQAHAWVEVYQDGLGWLPVEVTGQSGLDSDALGAHEESPEPDTPHDEPDLIEPPIPSSLPVGLLSDPSAGTDSPSDGGPVLRILLLVLAVVLLLSILPIRRGVLLTLRRRSFEQSDLRKAVIAMYSTAQKVQRYGTEIPQTLATTAERAFFSRHEISREEAEACREQLDILLKECCEKQTVWGRFRFRFISALL